MAESLKATTIRNFGYNSVAKIIQLVVMAIANIILTRTLVPADYGIVGFANIFTAFLAQFSDFGIGSAVIQKKDLDQNELYTAFTLKVIIGGVIFVIAYAGAPFALLFFDNPAIVNVIRILAFTFIVNTFAMLPNILLTRNLDYKILATANLIPIILNSIVAVTLAMLGFKYWSLVAASLVMSLTYCILMNYFHPVRYRFAFDLEAAKRFVSYGSNIFIAGFIAFVLFNADNFVIGAVKGATSLGYYSLAFNWGSMCCTIISSIVLAVLFPTFSKMQENHERLKNSYLKVLEFISFGGVLVNMTLFVVSRDFLVLILGHNSDKWVPALVTLRILCFYGIVRLLLEPVGNVMMALGRTDILRKATVLVAIIELSLLYPALNYAGIEGVALLVTFAYISQYILYYQTLKSSLRLGYKELLTRISPAILCIIPLFMLFVAGEYYGEISILLFIVKLVSCSAIYLVTYGIATKWKLYKDIRDLAGVRI